MKTKNKPSKKEPVIIVHLGNVESGPGDDMEASKTQALAERFPGFQFYGIDVMELGTKSKSGNWKQLKMDFIHGLNELDNDSVTVISSDLALGYFTDDDIHPGEDTEAYQRRAIKHTAEVIRVAYDKLKPGGRFMMVTDEFLIDPIKKIFGEGPFDPKNVEIRPITDRESERTVWMKELNRALTLYQIIAKK